MTKKITLLLALVAGFAATCVSAQTLINPATITSLPYTISTPGSYKLEGNLNQPTVGFAAIMITANGVTLDLNGYSVTGPVSCTSSGCSASEWVGGIQSDATQTTVKNGQVSGFGYCVIVNDHSRVENVNVDSCMTGIYGYESTIIWHNVANNCSSAGILGYQGVIKENLVTNSYYGIDASESLVSMNTVANNSFGIYAWYGMAEQNVMYANTKDMTFNGAGVEQNNSCSSGSC
jgi:hypothetical protein